MEIKKEPKEADLNYVELNIPMMNEDEGEEIDVLRKKMEIRKKIEEMVNYGFTCLVQEKN